MAERPWKISEAHYYDEATDDHHYGVRVTYPDGGMDQVVLLEGSSKEQLAVGLLRLAHQLDRTLKR